MKLLEKKTKKDINFEEVVTSNIVVEGKDIVLLCLLAFTSSLFTLSKTKLCGWLDEL